ncbi:MAG: STAS domain-containing protein [Trebonia sp.]
MPSQENLLAQQHDEQVVVTLPEEIDMTNSSRLRETLLAVISRQPAVVVADMTATTFCDCSGMTAIFAAYRQAVAAGADMRLVIRHPTARRVFELLGLDTVISVYPDLATAMSGRAETMASGGRARRDARLCQA